MRQNNDLFQFIRIISSKQCSDKESVDNRGFNGSLM